MRRLGRMHSLPGQHSDGANGGRALIRSGFGAAARQTRRRTRSPRRVWRRRHLLAAVSLSLFGGQISEADLRRLRVFKSIVDALHRGEKIELRGFGSFRLRKREPRKGRNPKTGDKVDVPPKKVPYFKPGKELKELINREPAASIGSVVGDGSVPPGAFAL